MILSPQSQLLERNLELFENGDWLFINPSDAYFADQVSHRSIHFLHQYMDVFTESVKVVTTCSLDSRDVSHSDKGFDVTQKVHNHQHTFAPFTLAHEQYSDVLIFMPKAKAHFQMLLSMAAGALKTGGNIYVVGENKGGIKSAQKLMDRYGAVQKIDSARHCSLLVVQVNDQHNAFSPQAWTELYTYHCSDFEWHVVSMPGVFSHGELDPGSSLLLDKLPSTLRGHVLDFACGAGVVGAYLLARYPHLTLSMLDVSAIALYCSAKTLSENNQQARLIAANGLHGVDIKPDHIVTNPPFHTGVKTDYTVTKRFISDAKRILKQDGTLHMVANRFLPYPGLLAECFSSVHTVAQTTQFSVYLASSR